MFENKPASFYTSYFNNNSSFAIKEEFKESEDEKEKDLYVGYVEVLNTIHELILRVEIPKSFPYQHLIFRTQSLSGYPHLIHRDIRTGEVNKYGDWFCLNTPFAETAEEQLEIEVLRLKEWISRQMRDDLPSHIKDKDVIDALRKANIYGWENLDEVNEIQVNADLTFVGDFSNNFEYFKNSVGHLHCIRTHDKRFYAFADNQFTNYELPYVIVDEAPKDIDTLQNFVALRNQYNWSDELCNHVLPNFHLSNTWGISSSPIAIGSKRSLETALLTIEKTRKELSKEEPYLLASTDLNISERKPSLNRNNKISTKVLPGQKELLIKELDKIENECRRNNGYDPFSGFRLGPDKPFDEMTPEEQEDEWAREAEEDYAIYVYPYEYHFFALGYKSDYQISWFILATNLSVGTYDRVTFDLGIKDVCISKVVSYPLYVQIPQIIDKRLFFGRGLFSKSFLNKKIAVVGLGAVGSMVAESLARSGVIAIGLWDNDIVEPGNICRSSYQLNDIGESKVDATARKIKNINPFSETKEIKAYGGWLQHQNPNIYTYEGGSFYSNINYKDQEQSLNQIKGYDIIIDCTGSNEMLHFLSYALKNVTIISLCITNHSNDLLCITNKNGNPFELRKAYLSRIEQDTRNFYMEGSGCYAPTFLARNCDISSLVNLAVRELNAAIAKNRIPGSMIFSHDKRGVLIDRLESYKAEGYDIWLTVPTESIFDAEEMEDNENGEIGYILGSYSRDGKMIMITHFVDAVSAKDILRDAFSTSKGIIDYIGDYTYSGEETNTYRDDTLVTLAAKAEDESINTNNPLLALRNPDGTVSFFLYLNNGLVPFIKQD